jgi:hypothetical protein
MMEVGPAISARGRQDQPLPAASLARSCSRWWPGAEPVDAVSPVRPDDDPKRLIDLLEYAILQRFPGCARRRFNG